MRVVASRFGALVVFCNACSAGEIEPRTVAWAGALALQSVTAPVEKTPVETGLASFSGQGTVTASGERFNPESLTAAHRSLPFGTTLRVTNRKTGQSVTVRVNDRGPTARTRMLSLSLRAARIIGIDKAGVAPVDMEVLSKPTAARAVATLAKDHASQLPPAPGSGAGPFVHERAP